MPMNIELTDYEKQLSTGVSPLRHIKRSDKYCPRCNQRRISRIERKCLACGGRVFWQGDDCWDAINRYEDFFIWYKNLWGVIGWTHKSFLGFPMITHPQAEGNKYQKQ